MKSQLISMLCAVLAAPLPAHPHPPGEWKDKLGSAEMLNNMVWELARVEPDAGDPPPREVTFELPLDRWIFVRARATAADDAGLWITLDDDAPAQAMLTFSADGVQEAMRYLPAGRHSLRSHAFGDARLQSLVVRAIPALEHAHYHAQPHLKIFGPYDWDFLERYINPHVNTMISYYKGPIPPELPSWKASGKKWITYTARLPNVAMGEEKSPEDLVTWFSQAHGLAHPLMDGIIVDEWYKANDSYEVHRQAIEQLARRFPGKAFHPYVAGGFGENEAAQAFGRACLETGAYIAYEAYISEWPTEAEFRRAMEQMITSRIIPLKERFGGAPHINCVLASFSEPWLYTAGYPNVNFNVQLDMQFQWLAMHPEWFGVGAVQMWHSAYSSEEMMRLIGALYRHYCIEGRTQRMLDDPYELRHIRNPNFTAGLDHWTVEPAEDGAIEAGEHKGYGRLQGWLYRGDDTFARLRRSEKQPNRLRQSITGLQPGRLYVMKMFVGDYNQFAAGILAGPENQTPVFDVRIEGATLSREPRQSFRERFPTRVNLGAFTANHPFHLTYYWQVFRANGPTAELTISDWQSETEAGAPAGQQLMFNFIEIRPFFDGSASP